MVFSSAVSLVHIYKFLYKQIWMTLRECIWEWDFFAFCQWSLTNRDRATFGFLRLAQFRKDTGDHKKERQQGKNNESYPHPETTQFREDTAGDHRERQQGKNDESNSHPETISQEGWHASSEWLHGDKGGEHQGST